MTRLLFTLYISSVVFFLMMSLSHASNTKYRTKFNSFVSKTNSYQPYKNRPQLKSKNPRKKHVWVRKK